MSRWERLGMDAKLTEILSMARRVPGHHFLRPFLTPYQIAIEFRRRYPAEFRTIGLPVGGLRTGERESLAKYIARELSRRIKNQKRTDIEGAFLGKFDLHGLQYRDGQHLVESSSQTSYHLSLFRLSH